MSHPERVNLEGVLGATPAAPTPDTRLQSRSWRVVRQDGSKTALPSASPSGITPGEASPPQPSQAATAAAGVGESRESLGSSLASPPAPALSAGNLGFLGGKGLRNAKGIDLAGPSSSSCSAPRPNIGMPKASPSLAETPPAPNALALGRAPKATSRPGTAAASTAAGLLAAAPSAASPPAPGKARSATGAYSSHAERDLQLLRVIEAWPDLSPRGRQAILAVIAASCER